MQQKQQKNIADLRKQRIQHIKDSLRKIPVIRKNTTKIQDKIKLDTASESSSPQIRFSHGSSIHLGDLHQHWIRANGFVNKCRKIKTGQQYAVKSFMMDEQHILELKINFLAIHSLKHPNIVEYHALYIDMRRKMCSIVMEYVKYPSLDQIKIQNQQELKNIIYQIMDSVNYLHQRSISHRDIKPENILYDVQNKTIKIIDFGTSKRYFRRNQTFEMLTITGTLFYRAPEVFLGGGYNQKVDIWAVGILIYKLVCGKTPFQSIYLSQTINRIKDQRVSFEEQIWKHTDVTLKNLIKRMLTKDKSKRLSAAECLRDIWFYSTALNKLSQSTKNYQIYQANLQNAEYDKKIIKKSAQQLTKNCESLTYLIQQIDGEDYHLIDSGDQDTECSKSSRTLDRDKRVRRRLTGSVIF